MSTAALKDSQVSLRLPNALKDKMEVYAQLTGRTKSHVAMEALSDYLDWRIRRSEDLKAAVAAADAGEFATAGRSGPASRARRLGPDTKLGRARPAWSRG